MGMGSAPGQGFGSHPKNLFWTDLLNVFSAPGDTVRTKESITQGKVPEDWDEIRKCNIKQGNLLPVLPPRGHFPSEPRVHPLAGGVCCAPQAQAGIPCSHEGPLPEGGNFLEDCNTWSDLTLRGHIASGCNSWQRQSLLCVSIFLHAAPGSMLSLLSSLVKTPLSGVPCLPYRFISPLQICPHTIS